MEGIDRDLRAGWRGEFLLHGRERLAALGFKRPADFIAAVCGQVYPPPPAPPEPQGTAPASA